MARRRLFISYDYDHDRNHKNLLLAWDANDEFDFSLVDVSADVSIDSDDAAVIKRSIAAKIGTATHFLCLVGRYTYRSSWVAWEISKAVELDKRIVAVKIDGANTTPSGLLGVGAKWAMSFTFGAIKKAMDEA